MKTSEKRQKNLRFKRIPSMLNMTARRAGDDRTAGIGGETGLMGTQPITVRDALVYFADPNNCFRFLSERRWQDGVVTCPTCGSEEVSFVASRRLWQCKTRHPKALFSVKVGTIFEDSVVGLDKWLTTMWIVANCENEVSSYRISRFLGIPQKTAWFMLLRIRVAMQNDHFGGMTLGRHENGEAFLRI
jgi:hypothetical protein